MRRYFFLIFLMLMCTMCSSGAEWQDVIDRGQINSGSQQSKPEQPSDSDQPSEPEKPVEPKPEMVSLGIVTDVHYADKDVNNERYYRESGAKLEAAVRDFNSRNVDMVISLGDIVDNEYENYGDINTHLASLTMPLYKILGNHDFISPFDWNKQNAALQTLGITNRYFSVIKGDFRLLFLDTSDLAMYSHEVGSDEYRQAEDIYEELEGEANAKKYNGAIGQAQQKWLEAQLKEAQSASQTVICFAHIPLYIDGAAKYTLWNGEEILDLLTGYSCVKAFVAGHHHEGGYADNGGIHHITLKGMVLGETNSYSIVTIHKDRLVIEGYGRQGNAEYKYNH